jgi:hypothetical protein
MIELIPITDPNQLTLGIESQVLTAVQQVRLEETKQKLIDGELRLRASLMRKRSLLLESDFVQDKDFVFSMEEVDTPVDVNVNHWSEERHIVTVNVKGVKGKCMLLFDRYDKNADLIVKREAGFDIENGKVECWGVTGSARKITFRKIKEKLAEKCSEAQWEMTTARNSRSVLAYTVEKYKKLAPTAEVTTSRDSTGHGNRWFTFDVIEVKFPNGNLLVVKPGVHQDQERVHKFVDVTTAGKSAEELAEYLGQ